MSSLFRSLNNFATKRENAIKEALISTLGENVSDIEYEVKEKGLNKLELCETSNVLCTTLEAIFLHGLKDSFLWQTINAIAGDEERRPEPSFWSPLLVFLHKQVIQQVQSLSQITSEIGQCRAWVRLSLNECLFSSYFNNMCKNSAALNPYYKRHAMLKDSAMLQTAAQAMQQLEAYMEFNLPVNSSLLNQWPDYALQLSGLWTPPLKMCPITSGVDIAGTVAVETAALPTPQPLRINEPFSDSISNSPFNRATPFSNNESSQRENLDLFLNKVDEMDIINEEGLQEASDTTKTKEKLKRKKQKASKSKTDSNVDNEKADQPAADEGSVSTQQPDSNLSLQLHGNSLNNLMQSSWSDGQPSTEDEESLYRHELQRSGSMTSSIRSTLPSPLDDRCSYNGLLRKHERNRHAGWTEVWDKFLQNAATASRLLASGDADSDVGNDTADIDQEGLERFSNFSRTNSEFDFVSPSGLKDFSIIELQEMVEQLCKLAHESGLDAQGFVCKSCQHPLGIGYSKFRVCSFSGNYFCDNCMETEPVLIPAKIIYNWDFGAYTVSKRAAAFIAEYRYLPIIDFLALNPDIYNASEVMAELQALRIRLNFIRAYLFTCPLPNSSDLLQQQKYLYAKEYLYEQIHQYSINDLAMVQRGMLQQELQKAFKTGEEHVLKCALCSMKGFHCEICNGSRVLYPFHIDTTYRCEECGAVFHAKCLNDLQPCPKCERKRKRDANPLIEGVQSLRED